MGTLGFIIFGRKTRDKDHGASYPMFCENCRNEVFFRAYGWRKWGHIFWIPLLPLTATRTLTCPVCGVSYELEKDEYKIAKELVEITERFSNEEISEEQYEAELQRFEAEFGVQAPQELDGDVDDEFDEGSQGLSTD